MGVELELMDKPHFGDEINVEYIPSNGHRKGQNWTAGFQNKNQSVNNLHLPKKISFKTNQTHLVCVNRKSLEKVGFRVSLVNSIDNTVEGYENEEFLIQSYAFSLGGDDNFTTSCMKKFIDCMEEHRAGKRLL